MSKRDWKKPLAIGLIVLILELVWAAFYVGSEIGEARGEHNKHIAEYERHAEDQIRRTCLNGQGGDISECVAEIVKATNEDQRSQRDLIAQTEMARWAFYMLIATIAMALITLFGVYYVARTLSVTREIGEKTVMAYLAVTKCQVTDSRYCEVLITIKNFGQSPADSVICTADFAMEVVTFDSGLSVRQMFSLNHRHLSMVSIESGGKAKVPLMLLYGPDTSDIEKWRIDQIKEAISSGSNALSVNVVVEWNNVFRKKQAVFSQFREQGRGSPYKTETGDRFVRPRNLKSLESSKIDFGKRPVVFLGRNVDPEQ